MANGWQIKTLCHCPVAPALMAFPPSFLPTPAAPPDSGKELLMGAAPLPAAHPARALVLPKGGVAGQTFHSQSARSATTYLRANQCRCVRNSSGRSLDARPAITAGRSDRGRSRSTTLGYVVLQLESSDRLEILQALKDRAALPHDARASGRFARNLATRPGRSSDDPYAQPGLGPQTRKTDRRGAVIPFMNFAGGAWLLSAAAAALRLPYTERPARAQGPVRSTAASPLARWQQTSRAKPA